MLLVQRELLALAEQVVQRDQRVLRGQPVPQEQRVLVPVEPPDLLVRLEVEQLELLA